MKGLNMERKYGMQRLCDIECLYGLECEWVKCEKERRKQLSQQDEYVNIYRMKQCMQKGVIARYLEGKNNGIGIYTTYDCKQWKFVFEEKREDTMVKSVAYEIDFWELVEMKWGWIVE